MKKNTSDKWSEAAKKMWDALHSAVIKMDEEGVNQVDIAKKIGVSPPTITAWKKNERGSGSISVADMPRYLESIGLNFMDFMPKELFPQTDGHTGQLAAEIAALKKTLAEREERLSESRAHLTTSQELAAIRKERIDVLEEKFEQCNVTIEQCRQRIAELEKTVSHLPQCTVIQNSGCGGSNAG
jgi:DNA-binding XRE family transcriptional regulator